MSKAKLVAKPSAAERTVDMFATVGPPRLEDAAKDDDTPALKGSENIERAAERWRQNAFFTQEHVSKHFNQGEPGKAVFRLTEKDGWMYLEQFRKGKAGMAYHYTGLMFMASDLYELTGIMVTASRARKEAGK